MQMSTVSQGWDKKSHLWKRSKGSSKAPIEEGSQAIVYWAGTCSLTYGRGAREAARLPFKREAMQMSTVS
jgi:hypothetical protein